MSETKLLIKYEPKTLEELQLPKRITETLKTKIGNPPFKLLLFGTQGTGKTSTAKLITKGHEKLYLSGSNEFTINTLREKIYPFMGNHSVLGKEKTLIIDEFERTKPAIQDAFKIILDQSPINVIFLTNHIDKVIPPIQSRFQQIDYNYKGAEITEQKQYYASFLKRVVIEEKIKYVDDGSLMKIFNICFPDFRKLLNTLQDFVDSKTVISQESLAIMLDNGQQNLELYELLAMADDSTFYTKATEYKGKETDCLMSLGDPFFKWLNAQQKHDKVIKAAPIVANYSNQMGSTPSKFGSFFACICELRILLMR